MRDGIIIFKKDFIYLFWEREEGRQKEWERNIDEREKHLLVAYHTPLTGDMAHNPGLCPDWESNWRPFGPQAGTQSTVWNALMHTILTLTQSRWNMHSDSYFTDVEH